MKKLRDGRYDDAPKLIPLESEDDNASKGELIAIGITALAILLMLAIGIVWAANR